MEIKASVLFRKLPGGLQKILKFFNTRAETQRLNDVLAFISLMVNLGTGKWRTIAIENGHQFNCCLFYLISGITLLSNPSNQCAKVNHKRFAAVIVFCFICGTVYLNGFLYFKKLSVFEAFLPFYTIFAVIFVSEFISINIYMYFFLSDSRNQFTFPNIYC